MDIVTLLVFLSVATLTLGIGSLTARGSVSGRLERLSAGHSVSDAAGDAESSKPSLLHRLSNRIERLASSLTHPGEEDQSSIRQRLIQAGYRKPSALNVFMVSRLALAAGLPILALILSPLWSLDYLQLLSLLGGAVVVGFVAPSHWVDRKRTARQDEITRGLPDALDLMVVCVEAGLGIQASLSRIAREFSRTNPIVSAEFELVTLETRAGKSTTDALRGLAQRSGVTDVASLVAMLVQTERFGTSLADTLRVQADSMRVARMQRAEEQAGKAPLKMMFPTIVIFAATLLVTLGPGMVQLLAFFEPD
jgi:tight adherence protein C